MMDLTKFCKKSPPSVRWRRVADFPPLVYNTLQPLMMITRSGWQRGFGVIELTPYLVGLERPEFTPVERVPTLVEAGSSTLFRVE